MVTDIEDLTINYEEDGIQLVKELDRAVLSRGAWVTMLFKYQEWDAKKEEYGPVRFTLRRYRKMRDVYRQQAKFNISSADQAQKMIEVLQQWVGEGTV